jgi:hypothetical protein
MSFPITKTAFLPKPKKRIVRLGDRVAVVAEPIKHMLMTHGPHWIKKKLENCNCHQRKEMLNNLLP